MPRQRTIHIRETEKQLRALIRKAGDDSVRARLSALLAVKEQAEMSFSKISQTINVPERTLLRWLAIYRVGGVEALLSVGRTDQRIPEQVEELIRSKISAGQFDTASSIRKWLALELNVRVSLPTVVAAMNRIAGPACEVSTSVSNETVATWVRALLEAMEFRVDAVAWIEMFRNSLVALVDVDRVSVDVNLQALQLPAGPSARSLAITHHVDGDRKQTESVHVDSSEEPVGRSGRILRKMTDGGFPRHDYHDPFVEEYIEADGTYLGTIILWRRIERLQLSASDTITIQSARKVIMRLLADCAARHQCQQPVNRLFYASLEKLSIDAQLTPMQQRVLTLRLLGNSFDQIAESMDIKVDTVHKHMNAVYKKSNVQGYSELYAIHFTPRLT